MDSDHKADVVFCLDASESMLPCFKGVSEHIEKFIEGYALNMQTNIDIRLDFVSHNANENHFGDFVFNAKSVFQTNLFEALYGTGGGGRFFTGNCEEFIASLSSVVPKDDEASLIALDFALDFPWRPASSCNRVLVYMTDEPFESGVGLNFQKDKVEALIKKIHALRVSLFMFAPSSSAYDTLSTADRCEYTVVAEGEGLSDLEFDKVLRRMGKTASCTTQNASDESDVTRGLFNQHSWVYRNVSGLRHGDQT